MIGDFYNRASWGAVPANPPNQPWQAGEPIGIALHYMGGSGTFTPVDHNACLQTVKGLQAYAMSGLYHWQYNDIEYNLAVCPHGDIIECRGEQYQDAAQLNYNTTYGSILLMMNVGDALTDTMKLGTLAAIKRFESDDKTITIVSGHSLIGNNPTGTECPGPAIISWIQAGLPSPQQLPVEDEMANPIPFIGQMHTFWLDTHGHLQHQWNPGGSENLQTRPGNPVAPTETLTSIIGCVVNNGILEVHTVAGDGGSIVFHANQFGQWGADRINPK